GPVPRFLERACLLNKECSGLLKKVSQTDEPKQDLVWTADGRHIAFTTGHSEVLLAIDSGNETELCRVTPSQIGPRVQVPVIPNANPTQSAAVDETPSRKSLAAEQSELFPGAGVRRGFGGGGGGGPGRQ